MRVNNGIKTPKNDKDRDQHLDLLYKFITTAE